MERLWKRRMEKKNRCKKLHSKKLHTIWRRLIILVGATEKTKKLWDEVLALYEKERNSNGGVLDIDTKTISTVSAHEAGYIDKNLEEIVGLQTDAPLKRAIMPYGGIRIVEK